MSTTADPEACPAKICDVGQKGVFLPIFRDDEQEWPNGLRVVLYMVGLGWFFLGVAIIADTFMLAIETITSKKARRLNPKTGRFITILVWNPTVANLTLMALGSSAPEILLSCIELFANEMKSGDLGPSTIVGSAAFNLFCITAVCVTAIPYTEDGIPQSTHIAEMPVFVITATCSVFAYLWLLIILTAFTPDVVTIPEGIITFMFFPLLVVLAFAADKGYFSKNPLVKPPVHVTGPDMDPQELAECMLQVRQKHGTDLTDDQVMRIIDVEFGQKNSRAAYRIGVVRGMTGGKRAPPKPGGRSSVAFCDRTSYVQVVKGETSDEKKREPSVLGFETTNYAVLESVGKAKIVVRRKGDIKRDVKVQYRTRDGSADSASDYTAMAGELHFKPGDKEQVIYVPIVDDATHEDDEDFFLDLHDAVVINDGIVELLGEDSEVLSTSLVKIDSVHGTTKVVIIDNDDPGVLCWKSEEIDVLEEVNDKSVVLTVNRINGSRGAIRCEYKTEDGSGVAGGDYEAASGVIEFEDTVMSKEVRISVKANGRFENEEDFRVILFNGETGNAQFKADADGGVKQAICTLTIKAHQENQMQIQRLLSRMKLNSHKNQIGHENWKEQFVTAVHVNGGEEGAGPPSLLDYFMHIITVPWKLFFALVPPVDYCDGWLCFFSALLMIGVVTALIGDLAALLGCTMGLPDSITAITFVALGTSLPDTFASKSAALQDEFADASIGNVTGSNSVNVFLGLGLPWAIGAIYWTASGPDSRWIADYPEQSELYPDGVFVVQAGSLGFSVTVFSCCACVTMGLLVVRRFTCGGELGGENRTKYASSAFLTSLWFLYVGLSAWYVFANSDCL